MPHLVTQMSANPLISGGGDKPPMSCMAGYAFVPHVNPKHLSEALLAFSSGQCGLLGESIPQGVGWGHLHPPGSHQKCGERKGGSSWV